MKRLSLLLFCTILSFTVFPQTIVRGYVFDDINGNGKKDKNEKGIKNVAVSNGEDIVVTNDKGLYELPIGEDNPVFVIKPKGYKTKVNEYNLPQFHYIHKPQGSPSNTKFKGTAPTGKLPKSVDFALTKYDEPESFSFFAFGDPQPYSLKELNYFRKGIVDYAKEEQGITFGISLGDICGDNPTLHQPYIEVMKEMAMPWYNVMGNHDMNHDAKTDKDSDESFEANFGPVNYAFQYGQSHFIILDDIIYPNPKTNEGYVGGFREDQFNFIENYLKLVDKNDLVIFAFHIPLAHKKDAFRKEDRHRFFELVKDYPNLLALTAHTHYQTHYLYDKEDGWFNSKPFHEYNVGTTNGDWYSGEFGKDGAPDATMRDGTRKGYAILNVEGNRFNVDYRVVGKPNDYQMEIYSPKVLPNLKKTSASIYVNFFIGSKNDLVEYRIDDSEWKKMTQVDIPDPSYLGILYKWDHIEKLIPGKRPSAPVDCRHLWKGNINTTLPQGDHQIEVRATDMFGKVHYGKSTYRIEKKLP